MPNHVQNIITFNCSADRLKEILQSIQAEDEENFESVGIGTIDFQKIIPMPDSLHIESGSQTTEGINLYLTSINPSVNYYGDKLHKMDEVELYKLYTKIKGIHSIGKYEPHLSISEIEEYRSAKQESKLLKLGKTAVENVINYGYPTWYEWRIANWGTKWNGYDYSYNEEDSVMGFQTAWSAPHPIIAKLAQTFPDVTISHQWADEDMGYNCGKRVYLGEAIIEEDIPEGKAALEFAAEVWDTDLADIGLLLNASGSDYVSVFGDDYELITIGDKYALFSNGRITMADIPKGLYCYDLRQDDNGEYLATVERHVAVNHGGSIIIDHPLDFDGKDHISINDDNAINFVGEEMDIGDYMAKKYEQDEDVDKGTRIELNVMNDPFAPVPSGTRGTVDYVDDMGQIHMRWDNGRTLALVPGEDSFRKLTDEEIVDELREQGRIVNLGDECEIVLPEEPIDCSSMTYFDNLEYDCWGLVEKYCEHLGIQMIKEDGEAVVSFDIVKDIQERILDALEDAGVELNFEHQQSEDSGMIMGGM